jgi:hypothetical protein
LAEGAELAGLRVELQGIFGRLVEEYLLVVGVVGDIAGANLTRPAPPAFYFPLVADPNRDVSTVVRTAGDPYSVLPTIRQIVRRRDPEVPIFEARTPGGHRPGPPGQGPVRPVFVRWIR